MGVDRWITPSTPPIPPIRVVGLLEEPTDCVQPIPLDYDLIHVPTAAGFVSSLVRFWRPGDTLRCKLCRKCSARHEKAQCHLAINAFVEHKDAPMFDSTGVVLAPSGD